MQDFHADLSKGRKKMRKKSRLTFKVTVVYVYLRTFQVNLFIEPFVFHKMTYNAA